MKQSAFGDVPSTGNTMPTKPSFVGLLGQRVLVHLIGMAVSGILFSTDPTLLVISYLGFICLIPRGNYRKPTWYLPFIFGIAQFFISCFLIRTVLAVAIYLGGLQSWLQRIYQNRGRLCWDWIVALPLLVGIDHLYNNYPPLYVFGSIGGVFLLGILVYTVYMKKHAVDLYEEQLNEDVMDLKNLLGKNTFPQGLLAPSKLLLQQIEELQKGIQGKVKEAIPVIKKIHEVVVKLVKVDLAIQPSKTSGWAHGLLKSENFGRRGDPKTEEIATLLQETTAFLAKEVRKFRVVSKQDSGLEEKLQAFEDMAMQLQMSSVQLPKNLSVHTEKIAQTSLEIVKNMREDPADRAPGERFLSRYLPAVQKIVDEHMRLSSGPVQGDVREALVRSVEVLERMEKAFQDELASLLQNDAINFTAEVDAIDAMLKMKGH